MKIILIALVINVILSFFVANEGGKKEIGYTKTLFLSFFFSPIIAMLFVINSPIKIINELITEEIIKLTPKLTEEEKEKKRLEDEKITKRDINIRIKFLVIFLLVIGIIYLLK